MRLLIRVFIAFTIIYNVQLFAQNYKKVDRFLQILSSQYDQKSAFRQNSKKTLTKEVSLLKVFSKETLEQLFGIKSNDPDPKVRALLKLKENSPLGSIPSVKVNSKFGNFATAEFNISALNTLADNSSIESIELGKPVELMLDASSPKVRAQEARGAFGKKGNGVILGFVDTGIDITHDDFKKSDGTTRILYLWDQNNSTGTKPTSFSYGTEWSSSNINSGACTHKDFDGHGTHVAGIASGNGRATGNNQPAETYVGMAPESDLIVTALDFKNAANIIDALLWCGSKAVSLQKPWVANLSVGITWGPRDGTSNFDQAIYGITNQSDLGKGRIIVAAAGNGGYTESDPLKKAHATGSGTTAQNKTLIVNSGTSNDEKVFLEIWYPKNENYKISITAPDGTVYGPYSKGSGTSDPGYGWLTYKGYVSIHNQHFDDNWPDPYPTTDDNLIEVTLADVYDDGTQYDLRKGNWTITMQGISSDGRWDAYIASATAKDGIYFDDNSYENARILYEPATAFNVITVGSYNSKNSWVDINGINQTQSIFPEDQISYFSSPGPTRDGRNKPDIYAPGAMVASSKSKDAYNTTKHDFKKTLDGKHIHAAGTSMSAPHVAGAVALLLEQNNNYTFSDISTILNQSKTTQGYLDVYAALNINQTPTGIEDGIYVESGPNTFLPGDNVAFTARFIDEPPSNYAYNWQWELKLFHEGGSYIYASGATTGWNYTQWSVNTSALPANYIWFRDGNGNISGKVIVKSIDNGGTPHESEMNVGVVFGPSKPVIYNYYPGGGSINLSYLASGAASYKVFYDINSGHPYSGTGAIEGNSPIDVGNLNLFKLTGLNVGIPYYVTVKGYNTEGESVYSEEVVVKPITTNGTLQADEVWYGRINIQGNVTVPTGRLLNILPGSIITLENNSALIVNGTLIAEGTSIDEITFDFIAPNSTTQNSIKVNSGGSITISYSIIKNGYRGIYNNEGLAAIDNCEVTNCSHGIYLYRTDYASSQSVITNCNLHDNTTGAGLAMYYSSPLLIRNDIYNNYTGVGVGNLSQPNFGNLGNYGNNNIHDNASQGVYALYYGSPFLGRDACEIDGGRNILENNLYHDLLVTSNVAVLAENNWWGSNSPSTNKITSSYNTIDYAPWLSSPPFQQYANMRFSPEENLFNKKFTDKTTDSEYSIKKSKRIPDADVSLIAEKYNDRSIVKGNNDLDINIKSIPVTLDSTLPLINKLGYAKRQIDLKHYKVAQLIAKEMIEKYPDSSASFFALGLLWRASKENDLDSYKLFLNNLSLKKTKNELYGVAEIIEAGFNKKNRIAKLNGILNKYKDTKIAEFGYYDLFLYYLLGEENEVKAKETGELIITLFPNSIAAIEVNNLLNNKSNGAIAKSISSKKISSVTSELPTEYKLLGNYPNPFNPSTTISYALPLESNVEINIFDIMGRLIRTFELNGQGAGYQNVLWNGRNENNEQVASGIYLYRFKAVATDGKVFEKTSKLLMLK